MALPSAGVLDINVESTDFAAMVSLLDDGGNTIASDIAAPDSSGAQLRMQVPAGMYTVQVFSTIPSGRRLSTAPSVHSGRAAALRGLAANPGDGAVRRAVGVELPNRLGLADLYSMSLPAAGTLELNLTSDALLNGILSVRDAKDNLVLMSEDVQGMGATHLSLDLPAGAYTMAAGARSGLGVLPDDEHVHRPRDPAVHSRAGAGYQWRIRAEARPRQLPRANGGPVDYYEFTLPSDATGRDDPDVERVGRLSDADGRRRGIFCAATITATDTAIR